MPYLSKHIKSLHVHVYERLLLALLLWFGCGCLTLSYLSLPLYKGKGSWLVIDSAEVFNSHRLQALYILGRPDGWERVQGWSLRAPVQSLVNINDANLSNLDLVSSSFFHTHSSWCRHASVAQNGHTAHIPISLRPRCLLKAARCAKLKVSFISRRATADKLCKQQLSVELRGSRRLAAHEKVFSSPPPSCSVSKSGTSLGSDQLLCDFVKAQLQSLTIQKKKKKKDRLRLRELNCCFSSTPPHPPTLVIDVQNVCVTY